MSLFAARRATTQAVGRSLSRRMSTAPRLHKAKDEWAQFVAKRPQPDHLDAHKCFHPPYNPAIVGGGIIMVWVLGYGSMYFGFSWQQKKQGYWK